jgi:hypothetical protein
LNSRFARKRFRRLGSSLRLISRATSAPTR